MEVGVNYPWRDYGWDFGLAPPSWREAARPPRWTEDIDSHLQRFRALGITVVRWFVLGDGLTYGTGNDAPARGPDDGWLFEPPPLSTAFREHFETLLHRFDRAGTGARPRVRLLPVFVDFHFCQPGRVVEPAGWIKGGRTDAIVDPVRRQRFLDLALEPLLEISRRYPDAIYAWDLVNEPEWITLGWHPHLWRTPPVDDTSMRRFCEEGFERVRAAGFRPTVGFALRETLRTSGLVSEINQVHHYPGGLRELGRSPLSEPHETILGEFATSLGDTWPELPEQGQRVLNRLRLASEYGYRLALPWSFLASDRHSRWSDEVERDIESFCTGEERGHA